MCDVYTEPFFFFFFLAVYIGKTIMHSFCMTMGNFLFCYFSLADVGTIFQFYVPKSFLCFKALTSEMFNSNKGLDTTRKSQNTHGNLEPNMLVPRFGTKLGWIFIEKIKGP